MSRDLEKGTTLYMDLLNSVEKNELLKAPPNMKDEIMEKIRYQNANGRKRSSSGNSRIQLFMYSMKVGVITAVALAVLFSLGETDFAEISENAWQDKMVIQMDEKVSKINNSLTAISNQLVKKEVFNNEKKEK